MIVLRGKCANIVTYGYGAGIGGFIEAVISIFIPTFRRRRR